MAEGEEKDGGMKRGKLICPQLFGSLSPAHFLCLYLP